MASFVLIIFIIATIVTGNGFSNIDDAEVDQLLKKLNKPALSPSRLIILVNLHKIIFPKSSIGHKLRSINTILNG